MGLLVEPNTWGWFWDNANTTDTPPSAPSASGVALTAGSAAKGTYVNISTTDMYGAGSVSTLANASHLMELLFMTASAFGVSYLIDIGVDPAGGTSYGLVASNLIAADVPDYSTALGNRYVLPIYIPAGASVAARVGSSSAGATIRCVARYYGQPSRPEAVWTGSFCESVGVANDGSYPTNGDATAITPGDSGAWSSWTSLGTTAKRLRYLNLGVQVRDSTMTSLFFNYEVGWGDATNPVRVISRAGLMTTNGEILVKDGYFHGPCNIPAGQTVYVRANCNGTVADGNTTCAVVGVG